jgi:predicted dehydrogenase
MNPRRIGIIMNGVTGRMGLNQHLVRSVLAIRGQGGVLLDDGSRLVPDPILVGRNSQKLEQIARENDVPRWTTDLDRALANGDDQIYFDAQLTNLRAPAVEKAIAAGKHIYCEKPLAADSATALQLLAKADAVGVRHGVVQDKLFLPGIRKLKHIIDSGFFGRIHSVRGAAGSISPN